MLIIVMGLPASGKSTFAKALSQQINAVYLNSDQTRNCLGLRTMYDRETKDLVYRIMAKALERHLQQQQTVVVDASFLYQYWRDEFYQLAAQYGHAVMTIWLEADEPVVRERLRRRRVDSEADFAVYQQMKAAFDPLTVPHLRLDSGRLPLPVMLMQTQQQLYAQLT